MCMMVQLGKLPGKLLFCLLLSSSLFAQDSTKKTDPVIIFQVKKSMIPAFFEMIDNSASNHLVVKQFYESLLNQYQRQLPKDTTKKK